MKEPYAQAKPAERLVGSATHVCAILRAFTLEKPALSLAELTAHLGLRKSSVHRLARTLLAHGFLAHDAEAKRYRLGPEIGACASVFGNTESAASLADPLLKRLRAATGETVTLQQRNGDRRRVIAQLEGTHSLRVVIDERHEYALTEGAAGRALRAFESTWQRYPDRDALAKVRRLGYAVSSGEMLPGITSIAMAIAHDAAPRFVVGVNGPDERISKQKSFIVRELKGVIGELSSLLAPLSR